MNPRSLPTLALRLMLAATLAASGYIHAQLYIDGYRFIHVIGPLFLLQPSAAFAVAALLLLAAPLLLRIAVAAIAIGALAGFATFRTIGLFGFTERGLQPAPQALLSLIAETLTLLTVAVWQAPKVWRHRRTRPHHDETSRVRPDLHTSVRTTGTPSAALGITWCAVQLQGGKIGSGGG
ncbi:hypothetical protein ACFV8T_40030 [Streptomyces sp. NPDC059832]|uniref:hypothetical protein n=1 Tax=Streptomyces sp. NPDC059832 TaxID=3346966 RepID=UPI003666FED2